MSNVAGGSVSLARDLYIDGRWVESTSADVIDVINPATERSIGSVPAATPADVNRAVEAAVAALPAWSSRPAVERGEILLRMHERLVARSEELAALIVAEVGTPITMARRIQAALPATILKMYAELAEHSAREETVGNSRIVREPVGVVGAITPWNFPLQQIMVKLAAALAAGCTVVLKPSELAPLNALALAEMAAEAGVPPGVFNVVTGLGPLAGEALVAHPHVDMISFTGSTRTGKRIAELAARRVARVALELGGKSANVILEDADFTRAVTSGINNAFLNSGQTCSAWTRMLVPRERQDEALNIAASAATRLRLGDPASEDSRLGPLISAGQRERVWGYIQTGIDEGARLALGGLGAPEGFTSGYYVRPTIFADVDADMRIAQDEIFGPVLTVLPYDDEDDAVRIANATPYGLAGAVWSADTARAEGVARRMRTGQVDINGGKYNPMAPFGGYGQSGIGRELGTFGLEEFLQIKSLQF